MKIKTVFFLAGINGPKKNGNQSLKNTVRGYLRNGYRVLLFDLMSDEDPSFIYSTFREEGRFRHIGMPLLVLKAIRKASRVFNGAKKAVVPQRITLPTNNEEQIDPGISEINWKQILLARAYTTFETFRLILFIIAFRPGIIYGFEIYGSKTASFYKWFLPAITVILRFMGTYVSSRNRLLTPIRYHRSCFRGSCDGIVMTNDGTRGDEVLASEGVPPEKILFLPNGIDESIRLPLREMTALQRKKLNPLGRKYLLGAFNRFYPFKRMDRAIRIHSKLLGEGCDVQLAIAGHGGPLEDALKNMVHDLGTGDFVTWLGGIPHAEMAASYKACDVVLIINDYANIGNQLLECLFLRVPLIAIDDGSNSRIWGDCPRAVFMAPSEIDRIDTRTIDGLIRVESKYESGMIIPWSERILREIRWVESK